MQEHRPTQKDIARRTGIAQATVSMALANNPRVSKETRSKVHQVAKELGYRPDPHLTALSAYRKRTGRTDYKATLAWIVNDPESENWKNIPQFYLDYYHGAVERAKELGYQVETHYLAKAGMTSKRLSQLLWARNIPGILFSPQATPSTDMDFDVSRFSAVTFGHTLASPALHTVVSHQSKSMIKLVEHVLELGYKRPGLALSERSDQRTIHNWSSSFWAVQQSLEAKDRLSILLAEDMTRQLLVDWIHQSKPDIVITEQRRAKEWLLASGLRIPDDLGLALISLYEQNTGVSGILENSRLIGARALEFLVDMIHRREYGVPQVPLTLMIDGTWQEGATLKRRG